MVMVFMTYCCLVFGLSAVVVLIAEPEILSSLLE